MLTPCPQSTFDLSIGLPAQITHLLHHYVLIAELDLPLTVWSNLTYKWLDEFCLSLFFCLSATDWKCWKVRWVKILQEWNLCWRKPFSFSCWVSCCISCGNMVRVVTVSFYNSKNYSCSWTMSAPQNVQTSRMQHTVEIIPQRTTSICICYTVTGCS